VGRELIYRWGWIRRKGLKFSWQEESSRFLKSANSTITTNESLPDSDPSTIGLLN